MTSVISVFMCEYLFFYVHSKIVMIPYTHSNSPLHTHSEALFMYSKVLLIVRILS